MAGNTRRRLYQVSTRDMAPNTSDRLTQVHIEAQSEAETTDPQNSSNNTSDQSLNKKRRGRGRTKCIKLDMKTKDGPLEITIPPSLVRAVGENAREIVNFIGYIVRTNAPLNVRGWKEVHESVGEQMMMQVKEKFQLKHNMDNEEVEDDECDVENVFELFVEETMRRLYRLWRGRLSQHYKKLKTEEERRTNIPEEVSSASWRQLVEYFKSDKFMEVSKRNAENRAKQQTKHTCGSRSYLEVEELTRDPETGEKKTVDDIWLIQHTRKTKEGNLEWVDSRSETIYMQLKEVVLQQNQEGCSKMTDDEILIQVLGSRSGYFRGKGARKQAPSLKGMTASKVKIQAQQKQLENMQKQMDELQASMNEQRSQMRVEVQAELQSEIRSQLQVEIRAKLQDEFREQMKLFLLGSMQNQLGAQSNVRESNHRDKCYGCGVELQGITLVLRFFTTFAAFFLFYCK